MTLTFDEFCENCISIETKSSNFPGYEWNLSTKDFSISSKVFLYYSKVKPLNNSFATCSYHVTYSDVYENPVLYFNVFWPSGQLLALGEVFKLILKIDENDDDFDPYLTVTQNEHPTFGRPYFIVHPCKTNEFMSKLQSEKYPKNYVLSWLSCVSTLINLELPLQLFAEEEER